MICRYTNRLRKLILTLSGATDPGRFTHRSHHTPGLEFTILKQNDKVFDMSIMLSLISVGYFYHILWISTYKLLFHCVFFSQYFPLTYFNRLHLMFAIVAYSDSAIIYVFILYFPILLYCCEQLESTNSNYCSVMCNILSYVFAALRVGNDSYSAIVITYDRRRKYYINNNKNANTCDTLTS